MMKNEPSSSPQVLIVDDDAMDSRNLSRLLEDEGYLCHKAENSLVALSFLEADWSGNSVSVKVVIADLYLGGLYGIDILQGIKKGGHSESTQVIVLMKEVNDTLWLTARQAGAYAIFTKPCNFDDLRRSIHQIINPPEI